jgi:PQQ-dependent catabolism-associated CXXCW motif protein
VSTAYSSALRALALCCAAIGVAAHASAQNSFGEATRADGPPPSAQPNPAPAPPPSSNGPLPRPAPGGFGNGPAPAPVSNADTDPRSQAERADLGVAPTAQLHTGEFHAPTPASIPGGQVITTQGLVELLRGGQVPVLLLDVLGGQEMIQGAVYAVPAAQSGSFNDPVQAQFGQFLAQATGGNKQYPIVLYCLSRECWMSYNASLRAINLGYTNVLWYRGGIEAWKQAGMPVQASGQR